MDQISQALPTTTPLLWEKEVFPQDFFIEFFHQLEEDDCSSLMQLNHQMQASCLKAAMQDSLQFQNILSWIAKFFTAKEYREVGLQAQAIQANLSAARSLPQIQDQFYASLSELTNLISSLTFTEQKLLRDQYTSYPESIAKNRLRPCFGQNLNYERTKAFIDLFLKQVRALGEFSRENLTMLDALETIKNDLAPHTSFAENIADNSYQLIDSCAELSSFLKAKKIYSNPPIKTVALPARQRIRMVHTLLENALHLAATFSGHNMAFKPELEKWLQTNLFPLLEGLLASTPLRAAKFLNAIYIQLELHAQAGDLLPFQREKLSDFAMKCIVESPASTFQIAELAYKKLSLPQLKAWALTFLTRKIQDEKQALNLVALLETDLPPLCYWKAKFNEIVIVLIARKYADAAWQVLQKGTDSDRNHYFDQGPTVDLLVPAMCQKGFPEIALEILNLANKDLKSKWALALATSFARKGEYDLAYSIVPLAKEALQPLIIANIKRLCKPS